MLKLVFPRWGAVGPVLLLLLGSLAGSPSVAPAAPADVTSANFSTAKMDRTADPRKDFARFAYGAWSDAIEIPSDKARWGGFDELGQRNWDNIRALLDDTAKLTATPGSNEQLVADFYRAALDTATREARGLAPLASTLQAIAAVQTADDVMRVIAVQHRTVGAPLFYFDVDADQKASTQNIAQLGQGGLGLPSRDYYLDASFAEIRAAYLAHLEKLFVLAGAAPAQAATDAAAVLTLETKLAEVSKTRVELRDPVANYNKLSRAEVLALTPPLAAFFAAIELPADATHFDVGQPAFFQAVTTLLAGQPIASWRAYLAAHALRDAAPYLSPTLEREAAAFTRGVLAGVKELEPEWQRAARVIDAQIGEALGRLFIARYFPPAVEARLQRMIAHIKAVFMERLKNLDWMTEATRAAAVAKFARFEARIGYPEVWRDYTGLVIRADDYFGNVERASAREFARRLARVGRPVDRREFVLTPQTVNAYFQPDANRIVFLAGILNPPFFDPAADDAVNFGAIGAVIGHEITHGFDDQGRQYDADGNLHDWWTQEDANEFRVRAQHLVEQFNAFEALPGLHVNGQLSLGENIADLGGVSVAYEALQRSLAGQPKPPLIDGFTAEQRFFLSWAQQWRTKFRDEALRRQVKVGPHAPGMFRAVGALRNLPEFYRAFDVREGDGMWLAPEQRAKIW